MVTNNPSLTTLLLRPLYYLLFPLLTIPVLLLFAILLPLLLLRGYDKTRNFSEKHADSSTEPVLWFCTFVWTVTTVLNGVIFLVDYEVNWGGGLGWWIVVLGISSLQYLVVMVGLGGLVVVVGGMIMLGEKVGILKGFSDQEGKGKKSDETGAGEGREIEKEKEKDYMVVSRPLPDSKKSA